MSRLLTALHKSSDVWTPTDIPNMLFWYDASDADTVLTDVDGVYQWSDKGPNGWHWTQSTGSKKPGVVSPWSGGLNAIQGDGFDDMLNDTLYGEMVAANNPMSFVWCGQITSGEPQHRMFSGTYVFPNLSHGITWHAWKMTSNNVVLYDVPTSVVMTSAGGATPGSTQCWINGIDRSSGTAMQAAWNHYRLISYFSNGSGSPCTYHFAEMISWAKDLSGPEIASVIAYLKDKWALYDDPMVTEGDDAIVAEDGTAIHTE